MLTMERSRQLPLELQLDLKKKTLPCLLEEVALQFPDKIAISTPHATMTFEALNKHAIRIAHHILSKDIDPQSRIAVFAETSMEMIIAMFGILRAGAIYVPIDPLLPKQKISKMLSEAKPALLLSGPSPIPSYLQDEVPSLSLQDLLSSEHPDESKMLGFSLNPKDTAYIVFTSEETENLKGIEISHLGVVNLIYWYRFKHSFGQDDTAAIISRPSSDISIGEILTTLCNGASVKIPPTDALQCEQSLMRWMTLEKISLIYLQVPLTETLLQQTWPKETTLRLLFTGGGQLKKHSKQNLPFTLVNNYGPLENSIISTEYLINSDEESLIIPIGRPIANVKIHVLDKSMQEVPHGTTGQLCLGGIGLAKGYINDENLNLKKFIIHTQLGKRPEKLFLTGDLVRKRKDGYLEYLGRIDQQEALGDNHIGISAIESILNSYPGIDQAVVKLIEIGNEQILVAYIVQSDESPNKERELKRSLKKRLPPNLIPKQFVQLNTIPVGANGKICFEQLPVPKQVDDIFNEDDLPQNAIEKQVATLWQEELNIEHIGTHKSLFDLKATSSTVNRLVSKINQQFGKNYSPRELLLNDSIAAIAELIMKPSCDSSPDPVEFQKKGKKSPLFCVHGWGGDLHPYYLLTKYLGPDYPVYGLPAREDDDSIEKMAQDYVNEILKIYPRKKFSLLGFSIGSYLVFEIARILKEKKRDVEFIGIIDTYAPHFPQKHPLLKRLQINTSQFFDLSFQEKKDLIIERWQQLEQKTSSLLRSNTDENNLLIPHSLKLTFQKAMNSYSPEPCEIPLTIFIAQDEPKHPDWIIDDPSKGWKDYTTNLTIEKIPGMPQNLLEISNIKNLAQSIKKHLDDSAAHS